MLYNKFFSCNYDELITYYPKYYREVLEMKAILSAHGKLLDDIEDNIEEVFNNCFINSANEETISRLEIFLGIGIQKNRIFEERRNLVKSFFVGSGKISASAIKTILKAFTDAQTKVEFRNGILSIYVNMAEASINAKDIISVLSRKVPAHLVFLLIGYYKIWVSQSIYYESIFNIMSGFYIRYNAEALKLDGTWKLNGEKSLNGYDAEELLDFYPLMISFTAGINKKIFIQAITKILSKVFYDLETQNRIILNNSFYPQYNTGTLKMDGAWKLNGKKFLNGYDAEELLDFYPLMISMKTNVKKEIFIQAATKIPLSIFFGMQTKNGIIINADMEESIKGQLGFFVTSNVTLLKKTDSKLMTRTEYREKTSTVTNAKIKAESIVEMKKPFMLHMKSEVNKNFFISEAIKLCFPVVKKALVNANMLQRMESIVEKDIEASSCYPGSCQISTETHSFLTVEKNLWYLDGQHTLDGKLLNAEIIEYELQ